MLFALQQFSLDFVQLQFKAYASKLVFLVQETFSTKIASLDYICVQVRPSLALCYKLGVFTEKPNSRGEIMSKQYTGRVLEALQRWLYQLLLAADAKLVYIF